MPTDDRTAPATAFHGFACPRCRDGALLEIQAEKIRGLSLRSEMRLHALQARADFLEAQLRTADLAYRQATAGFQRTLVPDFPETSFVQVFYGPPSGYTEAESVQASFPVTLAETNVLLRVPRVGRATSLRMDIGRHPALIEIRSLAFEANGAAALPREFFGEELKRICTAQGTSQGVPWRNEAFMQLSTGDDPQLLLQVPDVLKAMPHGFRLRVNLRLQPLAPF